ncbi:acyl-CoA dehydrogenase family protein [Jatrophihabitans sp. DSM 45814]
MDFELTSDQRLFRGTTKEFLEKEAPLTKVRELGEASVGFERDWWQQGAELGWVSMLVTSESGGDSISGNSLQDMAIVAEEMGRLVSPGPLVVTNVVAAALSEASNAAEHLPIIEELMSGESVATWAIYEPDHGWDPTAIALQASATGDGFTLSGVKDRVESGDQADYLLVTARTTDGLTQFIVRSDAPGITITPMESLDLVRRFVRVQFDNVSVPAAGLVGTSGGAEAAVERQLQIAVVLQCAELGGVVERTLEFTIQWAFDRYSFGRPLASYQALKHRFADMKLWLEASHGITEAATKAVQARTEDAAELVSVAKSYVGQRATDIIQDCVQLHGGLGVTWEHDIHLYLRRASVDRVTWGSPSEHRRRLADILAI